MTIQLKPIDIANAIGISERHARYILNDQRRPSLDVAKKLEIATGVPVEVWLIREKYGHPKNFVQTISSSDLE